MHVCRNKLPNGKGYKHACHIAPAARIREPVLLAVHPDPRHQLWDAMHLPGAQGEERGWEGG
jgi:hypothetical protein